MKRSIHLAARQELMDAADFYERSSGSDLSARYLQEFERIANLLTDNPGFGTPITKKKRAFPMKGFPYTVIYRLQEGGIRILVVHHQSRKPGLGRGRQ